MMECIARLLAGIATVLLSGMTGIPVTMAQSIPYCGTNERWVGIAGAHAGLVSAATSGADGLYVLHQPPGGDGRWGDVPYVISRVDTAGWHTVATFEVRTASVEDLHLTLYRGEIYLWGAYDAVDTATSPDANLDVTTSGGIARFDGRQWHGLTSELRPQHAIASVVVTGGVLHCGFALLATKSHPPFGIATWDGTTWTVTDSTLFVIEAPRLALLGDTLYAVGRYRGNPPAELSPPDTSMIARLDPTGWTATGSTVPGTRLTIATYRDAIAMASTFHDTIVLWRPSGRTNLPALSTDFDEAAQLGVHGGDLYVRRRYDDGTSRSAIARFNHLTAAWEPAPTLAVAPFFFAEHGGRLIAGGTHDSACTVDVGPLYALCIGGDCAALGVEEDRSRNVDDAIVVAPNPSRDAIAITGTFAASTPLRLVAGDGRTVRSMKAAAAGRASLDVSALPAGHYLLVIGEGRSARTSPVTIVR